MDPLQAIRILREFRLRAVAPDMTGREWDMTALAIETVEEALKPKSVPDPAANEEIHS